MKTILIRLTVVAAVFVLANLASAGTLTPDGGSPTFTPPDSFTNNTIVLDTTNASLVHLSGGVTIASGAATTVTMAVSGSYTTNPGDQFSIAYRFASDSGVVNPVTYMITLTVDGVSLPPQGGAIKEGLHEFEKAVAFPAGSLASSGTFSGTLTIDFGSTDVQSEAATPNTINLTVQQIDFMLGPTDATITPPSVQQNISTRLNVGTGENVAIGGFIVTGTDSKLVVLRGLGPSLKGKIGAASFLPNPVIELHDSSGTVVATDDNWMNLSADDQMVLTENNLAPGDPSESALVETLTPGNYTVIMSGVNGATGVGLVEVYDLDNGTTDSKLANISTRGQVGTGDNLMIGGFIIGEGGISQIVVRGLGPSLSSQGVSGVLADPMIQLADANGNIIDANDNWGDDPNNHIITDLKLAPTDPNESALYELLEPGNYTVLLSGTGATPSGIGLVESYNVDTQN